jgi:putative colanic acid biosysnthesis UDP-glucose lipid carrier transferase
MSGTRAVGNILASTALILLAPAITLIAIGVRITTPGVAIVRATRRRGDGTNLSFVRFRTNDKDSNQPTDYGRWLQRYSLDRLPTLVSLLIGEISLQDWWWDITREPAA